MPNKIDVDLIIKNGAVFTAARENPYFGPGAVAVSGRTIKAVGAESSVVEVYQPARVIDAGGGIIHPGLIDTHFHLTSAFIHMAPLSFDYSSHASTELNYTNLKIVSDDDSTAAAATAQAVALLRRGFTCFAEPGTVFETDAFSESIERVGSRAFVSAPYGWDDVASFADAMPARVHPGIVARAPVSLQRVVDATERELKRNRADSLVRGFACLYGEGSGSNELLLAVKQLANQYGTILNQHQGTAIKSTQLEVEHFGETGFARMARLGVLDQDTNLTHVHILDEEDPSRIRESGATITWCPMYSLRNGFTRSHRCYVPGLARDGVSVSLGVDSIVDHPIGASLLGAAVLSRQIGEPLAPAEPFYMHSINAANNIRVGHKIGSLEAGKSADIVVRGRGDITQAPLDKEGAVLATSAASIPVKHVLVDGKMIIENGHLVTLDEEQVLRNAVQQRDRLFALFTS